MKSKEIVFILLFLFVTTTLLFHPVFTNHLFPFPGDFLLAWHEPWKTDHIQGTTITLSHKAIGDDIFRQLYPFKVLGMEIIKHGEFPLWNPYNGSGQPLFAIMHIGLLNPFNLLFFVFPNFLAWSVFVMIQPLLIGLGTYMYCRKLGLSVFSSFFSCLIFMLSGFVVTRTIYGDYDYAIASLPFLLLCIESVLSGNFRSIFFIPFLVAFLIFSVQPQIILYILVCACAYTLYRAYHEKKKNRILGIFIAILFGIGLSSVQLIPTFELFLHANITSSSSLFIFQKFLLNPFQFVTILFPNYFGNPSTYNFWGQTDYIETVVSIGLIPVLLSLFSVKNKKISVFFLGVVITTILLTIDWFGTRFFYSLPIPLLSTSIPTRMFFLTVFAISILAGFGMEELKTEKFVSFLKRSLFLILPALCILALTFWLYKTHAVCPQTVLNCRTVALRNSLLELGVFALSYSGLVFAFYFKNKKLKQLIPLIGILILGLYNGNKFLPFSSPNTFLPNHPVIQKLVESKAPSMSLGDAHVRTDFASYFKFYDPNYYDPLYIRRYNELVSYANSGKPLTTLSRSDIEITKDTNLDLGKNTRREKLFNILGVSSLLFKKSDILSSQGTWTYKDFSFVQRASLPFAYFAENYEEQKDTHILKRLFEPEFDELHTVILEENLSLPFGKTYELDNLVLQERREQIIKLTSITSSPRLLVLRMNYYPGWKAYINKKETKIYRTNYTFQSIVVPTGKHTITFVYKPHSLMYGMSISLGSLLTLFVLYYVLEAKKAFRESIE